MTAHFTNKTFQNKFPVCSHSHLTTNKTTDDISKEESGLIRIREILSGFQNIGSTSSSDRRCGCPVPCKRKLVTLQSWRSDAKNKNQLFDDEETNKGFAFFQVTTLLKFGAFMALFFLSYITITNQLQIQNNSNTK